MITHQDVRTRREHRVVVVGSTGIVGNRLSSHFSETLGWSVLGAGRRRRDHLPYDFVQVDLTDGHACKEAQPSFRDATDLVYCARYDHRDGEREDTDVNATMFANALTLVGSAENLQHVHLMEGTKYYGSDIGPIPTPVLETDARGLANPYYHRQEELLEDFVTAVGCDWTISLPHVVCDFAGEFARNLPFFLGAYAAVLKELHIPFHFPGSERNYRALFDITDAALLADAVAWMLDSPDCSGERFNVTNGDFFRWSRYWPILAEYFGMPLGEVREVQLSEVMVGKEEVWRAICDRDSLQTIRTLDAAFWSYGDFLFTPEYDIASSTTKLRKYGYHRFCDSEVMLISMLERLRTDRALP